MLWGHLHINVISRLVLNQCQWENLKIIFVLVLSGKVMNTESKVQHLYENFI